MDFLEEFKKLSFDCLANEKYEEAEELLKGFLKLDIEPDEVVCYIAAIIAESKGLYGITKYYLQKGYRINQENEEIISYYEQLTGESVNTISNSANSKTKKLKILFVEGFFEALDLFAEEFRKSYELMGHKTYLINPNNVDFGYLSQIVNEGIDIVFSFNYVCIALILGNEYLVSKLSCPIISYNVDHVFFSTEKLEKIFTSKRFYQIVVDRDDLKYLNNFSGLKTSNYFLPHGGISVAGEYKELKDRSIDILYLGHTKQYRKADYELFNLCADEMLKYPEMSCYDVVLESVKVLTGAEEEKEAVDKITRLQFDALLASELVALGEYRIKILEELAKTGENIEIYGEDWLDTPLSNYKNVNIHKLIHPYECLEKMLDSKIIVNSMPWFKDGSHERILNGMLAKGIVVTDESKWINENFVSGTDCFIFKLNELSKMADSVKKILSNIDDYQIVADTGYKKAVAAHTWSHRAVELIEILEANL